jgi:hypothetical protein
LTIRLQKLTTKYTKSVERKIRPEILTAKAQRAQRERSKSSVSILCRNSTTKYTKSAERKIRLEIIKRGDAESAEGKK